MKIKPFNSLSLTLFTLILAFAACSKSDDSAGGPVSVSYAVSGTQNLFQNVSVSIAATTTGSVTSCTSSPALPAGLSVSSTTCAISGTPTVGAATTTYTITASGGGPTASATVSLFVQATSPTRVYGQNGSFTTGSSGLTATTLNGPQAVARNSSKTYIAEYGNNRVLRFAGDSTTPEAVYGQASYTTSSGGVSATQLSAPNGVATNASDNLWISNRNANRVTYYASGSTTATGVYGQASLTTFATSCTATGLQQPTGVTVDDTGVYIADTGNHRVLYYSGIADPGTSQPSPTRIYGQANATSCNANRGGTPAADTLNLPTHITVASDGVYITDQNNNRILFYPGTSTTATRVYGQASFTTNTAGTSATAMNGPVGSVSIATTGIFISDTNNNRLLYFPGTTTTATMVLGQINFTASNSNQGGSVGQNTLSGPRMSLFNGSIWVADSGNHRVLFY